MIDRHQPHISTVIHEIKDFGNYSFPSWRILKDIKILEENHISYAYSFDPMYKDPLFSRRLMEDQKISLQLLFPYTYVNRDGDGDDIFETTYHIYLFISNLYPYQSPIIMIDPLSSCDRMYRVQDGLEATPIFYLYPHICSFITHATHRYELMDIREYVEDCVNGKSFLAKMEHMYKYQVDLYSAYKLAVEAIQLKLE